MEEISDKDKGYGRFRRHKFYLICSRTVRFNFLVRM